jgi:glucosyl-3-phosphoglycerate phosphatase
VTAQAILLRHGRTAYNKAGRLQGQTDIPLDDEGIAQTRLAAAGLTRIGRRIDLVVTSPLQRARDTARLTLEAAGLAPEVSVDERLAERSFGRWEGSTLAEIQAGWPEEYVQFRSHREVDGVDFERRADVADRVSAAIRDGLHRAGEDGTVLFVSHGAAITLGLTALLGLDPLGFRGLAGVDNGRCSIVEPLRHDESGRRFRLVAHNV